MAHHDFKYVDCPDNCGLSVSYLKLMQQTARRRVCVVIPVKGAVYIMSAIFPASTRQNSIEQIIRMSMRAHRAAQEKGYFDGPEN